MPIFRCSLGIVCMKIGLFFGSFNPIHIGHLIIAQAMISGTDLEKVWFVVSPQSPHKKQNKLLHEFDRYEMVEQAISDNYDLEVSDVEFHMPKPSYTVDTLNRLQETYPQDQFGLIMGGDNLSSFHKWRNYRAILDFFEIFVYPRPGEKPNDLDGHPRIRKVEAPLLNISATYIRRQVAEGKPIKYLVPPQVEDFIRDRGFYHPPSG